MINHYYPKNLAKELIKRWPAVAEPLPDGNQLRHIISVAYQASLLTEEGWPVNCHILYLPPSECEAINKENSDTILLHLALPRIYNEQEIRRLSPVARRGTNFIAIHHHSAKVLKIWGMMSVGNQWKGDDDTLEEKSRHFPRALVMHVRGPGAIAFYCGSQQVLTLQNGHIEGHGFLKFPVAWVDGHFNKANSDKEDSYSGYPEERRRLVKEVINEVMLQFLRRSIFHVRNEGYGGLFILIPNEKEERYIGLNKPLEPKYQVGNKEQGKFTQLIGLIIERLELTEALSWEGFTRSNDFHLQNLANGIYGFADLLADLMAVDGALVLNKSMDIRGFGVEIQVPQTEYISVYKALDMDGKILQPIPMNSGGTRHRAAYRFCLRYPDCLAIVVSQDGTVQFVRNLEDKVVFWNQLGL